MAIIKPGLGQYHQEAMALQKEILAGTTPHEMAGYIGEGAVSFAFRSNDKRAVIKLPYVGADVADGSHDAGPSLKDVRHSVVAYSKGAGIPRTEQLIGWSEVMPTAMVTEYISGQCLNEEVARNVSRQHWRELFDTFAKMVQKEVYPALTSGNFLYQPQNGFVVIDYEDEPFPHYSLQGDAPQSMAKIFSESVLEGDIPENYLAASDDAFGKQFAKGLSEYDF